MYFMPEGYCETSQAIVTTAERRWPERWAPEVVPPDELLLYKRLNHPTGTPAPLLPGATRALSVAISEEAKQARLERLADFTECFYDWQKALFSGKARGCFCDERGQIRTVRNDFWGTEDGSDALYIGRAEDNPSYDPDGFYTRLILIPNADVDALAPLNERKATMSEAVSADTEVGPPVSDGAAGWASEHAIREAFQERVAAWPADKSHPSEIEDLAALSETLGMKVSRDRFRPLRAEIAPRWLERGRPRKPKSAGK